MPAPPTPAPVPAPPGSPNVLFIAIDDMRPSIGAYGAPVVTPAMDGLARDALLFSRAYANFPWCNPSRNSLLSGRRPDSNKVWNFNVDLRTSEPTVGATYVTLPQHFKTHGYYTTSTGKIFHGANSMAAGGHPLHGDYPLSWTEEPTDHGKHGCDNATAPAGAPASFPATRPGSATWCDGGFHSGVAALEAAGLGSGSGKNGTYYADTAITTDALSRLNASLAANQTKPWFLAVGYRDPHLPWRYPSKFGDLYPSGSVRGTSHASVPQDVPAMAWQWPVYFNGNYGSFWNLTVRAHVVLDAEEVAVATKAYYATISFTDSEIGRLLAALKASGVYDSTLIVLWSDHGQNVGEHATWCKMSAWEHSLRVAMLMKPPTATRRSPTRAGPPLIPPQLYAGRVYPHPVELLDIYKTLVDLSGLPAPQAGVEGDSLARAFRDPTKEVKAQPGAFSQTTRCLLNASGISGNKYVADAKDKSTYYAACVRTNRADFAFMGYSLRTREWRYTYWATWEPSLRPDLSAGPAGEELYDHRKDTALYDVEDFEFVNLAEDGAFASVKAQLRHQLEATVGSWQRAKSSEENERTL